MADVPTLLRGEFQDDYGERHSITPWEWFQRPSNRYHIVYWNLTDHLLIARNDTANASAKGRWTRMDWVTLDDTPPYDWAFCFSAYDAPSQASAEAVQTARPDEPKTGCNGHPYTRMRKTGE